MPKDIPGRSWTTENFRLEFGDARLKGDTVEARATLRMADSDS